VATVLMVEDDQLIREVVKDDQETAGYTVLLAHNAVRLLKFWNPARISFWSLPTSTCPARWTGSNLPPACATAGLPSILLSRLGRRPPAHAGERTFHPKALFCRWCRCGNAHV
jgi:hypothetical protein